MSEMCRFTSKDAKGKVSYTCGLAAQEGSAYCPRHTFLHNIKADADDRKERERNAARQARRGSAPSMRFQLIEQGYQYIGNRDCYGCHQPIEMWKNPQGNRMPFNPMPEFNSNVQSHFATCSRASDFRRAS